MVSRLVLYKHINNTDVAAEVIKMINIPGKDYLKIKVRWWNIGPHEPFCLHIEQWLTDAKITGNKSDKKKYSRTKWAQEWKIYESSR